MNCDIATLQESHLSDVQSMNMKQKWVGQIFSSPGTGESQGVCIFLAKNIPFKLSQSIIDKEGRYIIITGFLYNVKCTLINVYAPNTTQATFITSLGSIITKAVEGPIIMCGDFNLVQDPLVDRSSSPLPRISGGAMEELQSLLAITDIWRLMNQDIQEHTYYSGEHNSYSRIDYILMSKQFIQNVIDAHIHSIILSDHAPVSVSVFPSPSMCKTKKPRLNNSIAVAIIIATAVSIGSLHSYLKGKQDSLSMRRKENY